MKDYQTLPSVDWGVHLVETAPLTPLSHDGQLSLLRYAAHEQ